jgi:uncharacterized protein YqeY
MAALDERLLEDIKQAMKNSEKQITETLRTLRAQLKDERIKKGSDLELSEEEQVLTSAAKKRKEAIELFKQGGRDDLVKIEKFQLELIQKYLPEQLTEEDIDKLVSETVSNLEVSNINDLGRVMGALMPMVKGKADGKLVQQKVREALSKLS